MEGFPSIPKYLNTITRMYFDMRVMKEEMKKTSMEIPVRVWKAIGHLSLDQGRNMSEIVAEALEMYVDLQKQLGDCGKPLPEAVREIVSEHLKEGRRR